MHVYLTSIGIKKDLAARIQTSRTSIEVELSKLK
jgi:hypothetical protein